MVDQDSPIGHDRPLPSLQTRLVFDASFLERAESIRSHHQTLAHIRRPLGEVEAVRPEQGDGETVHAERDAGGVGRRAGAIGKAPGRAEVVAVVVEAHAGGRFLGGMERHQELELQRLLELAHRHDLAGAAEERIARRLDRAGKAKLVGERAGAAHPAVAEFGHLLG
jgi:hypothetical protein